MIMVVIGTIAVDVEIGSVLFVDSGTQTVDDSTSCICCLSVIVARKVLLRSSSRLTGNHPRSVISFMLLSGQAKE